MEQDLPAPYYCQDGITIYNADCLDLLPRLSGFDCVVMDPPYASGARSEASRTSSGAMVRGARWNTKPMANDQMTTTGFVWMLRAACFGFYEALPPGGGVLSFIDWRQWPNLLGAVESVNLRVNGMVVWDKELMGLGNGFRAQHELILFASKGVPEVFDLGSSNVIRQARVGNDDHPAAKPPALLRALLAVVCPPTGTVLDAFMGGGSTLLAAKQTGRQAIGVELSEEHCETAAKRLAQSELFSHPSPRALDVGASPPGLGILEEQRKTKGDG